MEKITWTYCVKNGEVLLRVNEERNILCTITRRKANWVGHTLRRDCLLKHVTEGKIEGTRGRERGRRKQLLDGLKESRRYWNLKAGAPAHPSWTTCCGRVF
jgi:hypothetical protein